MTIYVIAGPPGIGAGNFIPTSVPIVDQDLAGYQYKKRGFTDYQDLASLSTNQRIKEYLFTGQDFALELNLGFPSHYTYLKSIAHFDRSNVLHLLLFFTDDLDLCLVRTKVRYLNGGHLVSPGVVEEMYANTLPLLAGNIDLFRTVRLLDVADTKIVEHYQNKDKLPLWIVGNGLEHYLPE